jgi:hypothetical protein
MLTCRTTVFTKPTAQIIPRLTSTLDRIFLAEVETVIDAVVSIAEAVVCPPSSSEVVAGGALRLEAYSTDILLLTILSSVLNQLLLVGKMV